MNGFTYRFFEPERDYPAVNACLYGAFGEYLFAGELLRHFDSLPDPRLKRQRWIVADQAGNPVATAEYNQRPMSYHPDKFWLTLAVRPEFQRNGVGSKLYDLVLEALSPLDPLTLSAGSREDLPHGVQFLAKRGFSETMRLSRSLLDVQEFDMTPYASYESDLAAKGIVIKPYNELAGDPARDAKLHALNNEFSQDIPFPEPFTPSPLEEWRKGFLGGPGVLKEALFVAVDSAGQFAGMTAAAHNESPRRLHTIMTGVGRNFRRMGIATALKLRTMEFCKANGYPEMATNNSEFNAGMLAVNARLGYRFTPAIIFFEKKLREG